MTKKDWYDAGDEIRRLVQDAVDSRDFSELSNTIANVVNDTVNGLQSALRESMAQQTGNGQRGRERDAQASNQNSGGQRETWDAQASDWSSGGQRGAWGAQASDQSSGGQREAWGAQASNRNGGRDAYQYTNREAAERIRRNMQEKRTKSAVPVKAKGKVPGELSGRIMKWTGYSFGSMFGLSLAMVLLVSAAGGFNMMIPGGILAILFGASMSLGRSGSLRVRLANRFRRYKAVLGDRTYCLVEELASAIGKTDKFVQKDLKKMIERGFFKEGYLAGKETLLITDSSTYQQYLGAQTEYERRAMEAERQSADDAMRRSAAGAFQGSRDNAAGAFQGAGNDAVGAFQEAAQEASAGGRSAWSADNGNLAGAAGMSDGLESGASDKAATDRSTRTGGTMQSRTVKETSDLPPKCREIVEEGRTYIRHIHMCNEKIPGEEMSAKLDRLELVITRIFYEAEKNPEAADDLKKMMSYYLPTTRKLLDAYCEMDEQPIAGQNIETTKKEIETTLDTLNEAFENLLDSLFEEKAWDISSDISVLHTMLAQEGLTGDDFARHASAEAVEKEPQMKQ